MSPDIASLPLIDRHHATVSKLGAIFDAAGLPYLTRRDQELVVACEPTVYVLPHVERGYIRFLCYVQLGDEAPVSRKVHAAHGITRAYPLLRLGYLEAEDRFLFATYLPLAGGIRPASFLSTFRMFVRLVQMALTEYAGYELEDDADQPTDPVDTGGLPETWITPANISQELLVKAFAEEGLQPIVRNADMFAVRTEEGPVAVSIHPQTLLVRLSCHWRLEPGTKRAELLAMVNKMNLGYTLLGATIDFESHDLDVRTYLNYNGGLSLKGLVHTAKALVEINRVAVRECGVGMVQL